MRINLKTSRTMTLAMLICALATVGTVFGQTAAATAVQDTNYRIGPGDVIDVIVSPGTELTRTGIRVNNQGMIQLPKLDMEIQAGCLTERELAEQIKEKYKKYVINPYVIVAVKEFNSNPVAVIGAVNSAGRFQLQRQLRLSDLLTWVNGPAERAGATLEILRNRSMPYCEGSQLVAPSGMGDEVISVNIADAFRNVEGANPVVRAGDVVRVPDAAIKNAFVIGSVKSTVSINLKEPVTLSQAIAMAGGPVPGAQLDKIIIRRRLNDSISPTEVTVSLKDINARKRDDLMLQPNDIVDVPGPKKTIWSEFVKIMSPTIMTLPLRVIP